MATLAACADAIEARLATISGLRVFDHPPQGAIPPAAFMVLTGWEPEAMGRAGLKQVMFDVYVFTAETARPVDGYKALLEYADSSGAKSIDLAMWDGMSGGVFGGLASTTAHVAGFRVLGEAEVDAFQMYGGVFTVEVHTKG